MRKIYHKREKCIGCAYCIGIAPAFWTMNEEDGKCDLIGAIRRNKDYILEIFEEDLAENVKAVEICPAHCIRIE